MEEIINRLTQFKDLTEGEIAQMASDLFQGKLTDAQTAAFLVALKMKGETATEMAGLAEVIQQSSLTIPTTIQDAMDNCGTGGDQSMSFNISTTAAFVLAAGGVKMAKHGNRSITSKSGSADVLEELGIRLDLSPDKLGAVFDKVGMVFLFAQSLHPSMKYVTPIRKELTIPTIMNLIGPLTNPISLKTQLLGTSRPDLLEKTAQVLQKLGRKQAVVVSGPNRMDEAALHGENHLAILKDGKIKTSKLLGEDYGFPRWDIDDIKGGSAKDNAHILLSVLNNEQGPYLDTTLLNAGLGFFASGKASTIADGIQVAREVVRDGLALRKLEELQKEQV